MKTLSTASIATMIGVAALVAASYSYAKDRVTGRGLEMNPIVYVTSQGLFYDSFGLTELPLEGDFQELAFTGPSGFQTEFGPGDAGSYVGGRWWVDVTNDGIMNEGDKFFLCPLLGPGRINMN